MGLAGMERGEGEGEGVGEGEGEGWGPEGVGEGGGGSECIDPIISVAPPLPLQLSGMASNLNMTHPFIWTLQIARPPAAIWTMRIASLPLSGLCE
jgi:hypothetical protein